MSIVSDSFFLTQLLTIYKGLVCPRMEYACHLCGGLTHAALLDRVESNAIHLISSPPLTNCLPSLKLRHSVASLAIFYLYFQANCSYNLVNFMPPPLQRPRCIRLPTLAHSYNVQSPYAKVNQYFHSFISSTGKLWNSLPLSAFPPAYDLDAFKRGLLRNLVNSN